MYFVLEDDLSENYLKFSNNQECDKNIIKKLLYYYKSGFIFNLEQLKKAEEIIDGFDKSEFLTLLSDFDINVPIEELAKQTKLKLILSASKSDFPYLNINGDRIENNLTATFYKNEPRNKAKDYIGSLLESSKYIIIYDKYVSSNFNSFKQFVKNFIPNNATIECICHKQQQITELKSLNKNLKIKQISRQSQYMQCHDRYILIDQKIEIILTSGIDYLLDDSKDFTYIIRNKN